MFYRLKGKLKQLFIISLVEPALPAGNGEALQHAVFQNKVSKSVDIVTGHKHELLGWPAASFSLEWVGPQYRIDLGPELVHHIVLRQSLTPEPLSHIHLLIFIVPQAIRVSGQEIAISRPAPFNAPINGPFKRVGTAGAHAMVIDGTPLFAKKRTDKFLIALNQFQFDSGEIGIGPPAQPGMVSQDLLRTDPEPFFQLDDIEGIQIQINPTAASGKTGNTRVTGEWETVFAKRGSFYLLVLLFHTFVAAKKRLTRQTTGSALHSVMHQAHWPDV
jgi:hypothetical protein